MALALPTAWVSRCVPPMPGMMPSLISGWPNFALSAAMMRSHCMASSQPPPSAKPATAAITGLRACGDAMPRRAQKSAKYTSVKLLSAISLMSAPAANAFSEPVMTMQPILSSASKASTACSKLAHQRAVERIERLRPVEPDQSDPAACLDDDVFGAHFRLMGVFMGVFMDVFMGTFMGTFMGISRYCGGEIHFWHAGQ